MIVEIVDDEGFERVCSGEGRVGCFLKLSENMNEEGETDPIAVLNAKYNR